MLGASKDGVCHDTVLCAGGCCFSRSSCRFFIFNPEGFRPWNFAFLMTVDLLDIPSEVLQCFLPPVGVLLSADVTGSGRFKRSAKLGGFSFSGER